MGAETDYWRKAMTRRRGRRSALKLTAGGGAALIGASLAGCGSKGRSGAPTGSTGASTGNPTASQGTPKKGGRLQWHSGTEAPNLDPTISISTQTHNRISLIYNKLATFRPAAKKYDYTIVPDLADSWESTPDGLTWTFHLHPGVKWANVPPLNNRLLAADDVLYTVQRNTAPDAANKSRYAMIAKAEAPDKQTVTFTLSYPHPQFLFNMAADPSEIQPREAVEQKGDLKDWGAGTGPFIITKYEPSSITVYDRNPDYFRADQVYLDGMDELIIADLNAAKAGFRTGKLDMIGYTASQQPLNKSDKDELVKTNPQASVSDWYSTLTATVESRFGAPTVSDVRVRQAINYAFNRDAFIQTIAASDGVWTGTFPYVLYSQYALSQDDLKKYLAYDPKKAKDLMAAAGFGNGSTLKMMWRPQDRTEVDLYIAMLKQIGITLDTASEAVDYPAWVSKTYNGQFSQLAAWGYGVGGFWDYLYGIHHSTGNRNGPQTKVPEIDQKLDEAVRTPDHAKQVQLAKEVETWALTQGLYDIPIFQANQYRLVQPWVKNLNQSFGTASVYTSDFLANAWLDK